jgi:sec-independent protein translocase protein TatA
MFGLGYQELLIILVIVLILFGANRLPELARSLGSSVKEFKKGVNEAQAEDKAAAVRKEEEKKAWRPSSASTSAARGCVRVPSRLTGDSSRSSKRSPKHTAVLRRSSPRSTALSARSRASWMR